MNKREALEAAKSHWVETIAALVGAAATAYAANQQKKGQMAGAAAAAQPSGASAGSFTPTATALQGQRGGGGLGDILGKSGSIGEPPPAGVPVAGAMRQEESRFSPAGQAPTPDEAKKDIQVAGSAGVTPAVASAPASSGTAPKAEGSNLGLYANLASTGAGIADALRAPTPSPMAPVSPGSMNFQSSLDALRRRRGQR